MKRYQYKMVWLADPTALKSGTYEPPVGWRAVGLSIEYAGGTTLLLEREIVEPSTPYRDPGE